MLHLHFEWRKVNLKKCQKWSILASFWKPKACCQTVLPDRSIFIGQKLAKNPKIEKFNCEILGNFQTLWMGSNFVHEFDIGQSSSSRQILSTNVHLHTKLQKEVENFPFSVSRGRFSWPFLRRQSSADVRDGYGCCCQTLISNSSLLVSDFLSAPLPSQSAREEKWMCYLLLCISGLGRLSSVLRAGPAYNATLRQCDNATIHDFILFLPSHFIFNKVRQLQVSPRQVKINIMRHNVENGVKINKMRQCPFLKQ